MTPDNLADELWNIAMAGRAGLWPGDTLSHRTANECVRLGWAERDESGNLILTGKGRSFILEETPDP